MKFLILGNLIVSLFIVSGSLYAQDQAASQLGNEVFFSVTAVNEEGDPVVGLKRESFRLFVDKKPLSLSSFAFEDGPISIGFLIDVSPSMSGSGVNSFREGVLSFLEKSNSNNEYFVSAFHDKVEKLLGFANRKDTETVISSSPFFKKKHGRQTVLYDAISDGIDMLSKAKNRICALVILSDGQDSNSAATYRDIERLVTEKKVIVYFAATEEAAGLGMHTFPSRITKIAEISGGRTFFPLDPHLVRGKIFYRAKIVSESEYRDLVFSHIANELQNQYILGFRSEPDMNNKARKIEVKLELSKEEKKRMGRIYIRHRQEYSPSFELVVSK